MKHTLVLLLVRDINISFKYLAISVPQEGRQLQLHVDTVVETIREAEPLAPHSHTARKLRSAISLLVSST